MFRRLLSSTILLTSDAISAVMFCSLTAPFVGRPSASSSGFFLLRCGRQLRATTLFFVRRSATSREASSRSSKYLAMFASQKNLPLDRPPDPSSFSSSSDDNEASYVKQQALLLRNWMRHKQSIVCITGAGMSTESGIPDYRGNNGSYFLGHKPIIHHEFMTSPSQRKRYWARSLVGFSPFANAQPNMGHVALAKLEMMGYVGVQIEDCTDFEELGASCVGHFDGAEGGMAATRRISVITQNVDILHSKAGVKNCLHLHGRGDLVRCMNCGFSRYRKDYHDELIELNHNWLSEYTAASKRNAELRPDGDAELGQRVSYDELILPSCTECGRMKSHIDESRQSFFKTDVVFFGDSVPKHRFGISHAAIDAADGILCIGTSLAVHSAFRLVRRGVDRGTSVAILNVGQTRLEMEGLGDGLITKIESPIGETLSELVNILSREEHSVMTEKD